MQTIFHLFRCLSLLFRATVESSAQIFSVFPFQFSWNVTSYILSNSITKFCKFSRESFKFHFYGVRKRQNRDTSPIMFLQAFVNHGRIMERLKIESKMNDICCVRCYSFSFITSWAFWSTHPLGLRSLPANL